VRKSVFFSMEKYLHVLEARLCRAVHTLLYHRYIIIVIIILITINNHIGHVRFVCINNYCSGIFYFFYFFLKTVLSICLRDNIILYTYYVILYIKIGTYVCRHVVVLLHDNNNNNNIFMRLWYCISALLQIVCLARTVL